MGLDIYGYRKVRVVTNEYYVNEDHEIVTREGDYPDYRAENVFQVWDNDAFPGRCLPFVSGQLLVAEDAIDVFHWSYGTYNRYRNRLAQLAGWTNDEDAWRAKGGKLWELISFSDCEGIIGTPACQKILRELKTINMDNEDDRFATMHKQMIETFEYGADDGVVEFR